MIFSDFIRAHPERAVACDCPTARRVCREIALCSSHAGWTSARRRLRSRCAARVISAHIDHVSKDPDCQSRGDRLPRQRDRAATRRAHSRRVLRRGRRQPARSARRRGGAPRAGARARELPARRSHPAGGTGHRRPGDPPGLRLPLRERVVRAGLRRCRDRVHRAAAVRDPRDGQQERGQGADGARQGAAGSGLPRRGAGSADSCMRRPTRSAIRC